MRYRTLPREVLLKSIEGIPDILTPAVQERDYTIKRVTCPRCRGPVQVRFHPNMIFDSSDPLPRSVATCGDCGYTMDPQTGLVHDTGDPRKAVSESLPSKPG